VTVTVPHRCAQYSWSTPAVIVATGIAAKRRVLGEG